MGRRNFAFTLIELLIVVAVVGLLAILVITALRGNIFKGNDAKRKSDLNRIKIALEEYEKDHNCYPSAAEMNYCGASSSSSAIYPYLSDIPCDPVTKEPYYYEPDPDSLQCVDWFRIYAKLQNNNDPDAIIGIGENSRYSYYIRSENAPVILSGSTPVPSSAPAPTSAPTPAPTPATRLWGCINGTCQPVPIDSNGIPICSPTFDNPQCNGNPCSGPGAPTCIQRPPASQFQ